MPNELYAFRRVPVLCLCFFYSVFVSHSMRHIASVERKFYDRYSETYWFWFAYAISTIYIFSWASFCCNICYKHGKYLTFFFFLQFVIYCIDVFFDWSSFWCFFVAVAVFHSVFRIIFSFLLLYHIVCGKSRTDLTRSKSAGFLRISKIVWNFLFTADVVVVVVVVVNDIVYFRNRAPLRNIAISQWSCVCLPACLNKLVWFTSDWTNHIV